MEQLNCLCFSEGALYPIKEYANIVDSLDDTLISINNRTAMFSWRITGFSIVGNVPIIVFPKNYTVPESDEAIKEEAGYLFKALIRYRNEHEFDVEERRMLFGEDDGIDSTRISSSVYIIDDYLQYGLIQRKRTVLTKARLGRIDWMRTINTTVPIVGQHSVVYTDPVMSVSEYDRNSIVRKIHQYVLYDCAVLWGWLLDFSADNVEVCELPCPVEEALEILRVELASTFVQREINLINSMIDYLSALQGARDQIRMEFLCTPYFHWVWEAICGHIFSNEYAVLKKFVPSPKWHSDVLTGFVDQRPDILFVDGDKLHILDAKYYNYHRNVPGWHDLVKQFYYRHTLEKAIAASGRSRLSGITKIVNSFVFPGDKGSGIQYLGYADVDNNSEFGIINAISIDCMKAIMSYAQHEESEYRIHYLRHLPLF